MKLKEKTNHSESIACFSWLQRAQIVVVCIGSISWKPVLCIISMETSDIAIYLNNIIMMESTFNILPFPGESKGIYTDIVVKQSCKHLISPCRKSCLILKAARLRLLIMPVTRPYSLQNLMLANHNFVSNKYVSQSYSNISNNRKWTLKICSANKSSKTTFVIRFNLLQVCLSVLCCICCVNHTFLKVLSRCFSVPLNLVTFPTV